MAEVKRREGRETWHRLLDWDKGQTASERLAGQIAIFEKYEGVDPSHPLGGKDGGKDIICFKGDKKFIIASYFPRGKKSISVIKKKFEDDLEGIEKNKADGIVFLTNQELTLGQREALKDLIPSDKTCDIIHLERIATILNSPINYGIRLEYLDIDMNKEEQVSFTQMQNALIKELLVEVTRLKGIALDASINKEPISVKPEVILTPKYPLPNTFFNHRRIPYHRCSSCKFGFRVEGWENPSINLRVDGAEESEAVTCPKCGNVDLFHYPNSTNYYGY